MTSDHNADQQINKLLLLGAGESGKSTLFKQMIQIYGKGEEHKETQGNQRANPSRRVTGFPFCSLSHVLACSWCCPGYPESERKNFIPIIYNNIIMSMKVLCQQCDSFAPVAEENIQAKKLIEDLKGDEEIDESIGNALQNLWADSGIQTTYDNRAAYQLTDCQDDAQTPRGVGPLRRASSALSRPPSRMSSHLPLCFLLLLCFPSSSSHQVFPRSAPLGVRPWLPAVRAGCSPFPRSHHWNRRE